MAEEPLRQDQFVKIAGPSARWGFLFWFFIGNRLFLGPGHLVSVTYSGMPLYERYHRFYFSDIASITYGPTRRQTFYFLVLAVVWFSILALFAVLAPPLAFQIAAAITTFMCGVAAVINYIKGERCRFVIRTAVQTAEIPAVSTMARAEIVAARIIPLIQSAQGKPGDVGTPPGSMPTSLEPAPAPPPPAPPPPSWNPGATP
ncbi:hypothetical protein DB346_22380 [Verrucomicrobia bacterium LW23]|nr:hypothetical protein DB346_22380 [Verrucomicrobia bacterium LW23]